MSYTHSKERFTAAVNRAAELIRDGGSYRSIRDTLVAELGCSRMAAHRAYHRARAGGDGDNWGGAREGSGRPKQETYLSSDTGND